MEHLDFLDALEKAITHAGSDEIWKRKVGDKVLWFSPITSTGQEKVNEALASDEFGVNVVFESKKVTLSHAIVGIGDLDLSQWREGQAVFPSTNREGKKVKVRLEEYMYSKMSGWGGQYVDDVFSVYADLLESHQKSNLKEIRFENAKDPKLELLELETRVKELREQLGMPPLVEQGSPAAKASPAPEAEDDGKEEDFPAESPVGDDPDFDPFKSVRNDGPPKHVQEAEAARSPRRAIPQAPPPTSVQRPYAPADARPAVPPSLEPLPRTPTPEDELFSQQAQGDDPLPPPGPRSIPLPPVRPDDVLEIPAERNLAPPPRIDNVQQNVNPRFARPTR